MDARILGVIGGVALVLALLSPLVLGSSQKVERLFEDAETLYERSNYKGAIPKYKEALKESKKIGAKTERIDKDFITLVNLKIAQCYYELAGNTSNPKHYQTALTHIREVVLDTKVAKHQEELNYLWAEILYKTTDLNQAKSKFSWLIEKFPNSQWMPKALYTIGDINFKQANHDDALSMFQKLVDEFPSSEFTAEAERRIAELRDNSIRPIPVPDPIDKTMYNTAVDLQRQGKVHDAYKLYTDLITQYPKSKYVPCAYVGKAEIHLEAKDYVNARANYEEAIYSTTDEERRRELSEAYHRTYLVPVYAKKEKQPKSTDMLFVDARLLRQEERFLDAAKIYEQLANSTLSADDMAYTLYWKGRCYYEAALMDHTLFSKSVDAFKKLIGDSEDNSYDIETYYYLTQAYIDWARVSEAPSKCQLVIDTVEEAVAKYVDSDNHIIQGRLSRMRELKKIAIQKISPEPVPDPNSTSDFNPEPEPEPVPDPEPVNLVQQGNTHLQQGEFEEATEKARQALNLDRNYRPAHELLDKIKQRYYGRGWTFYDDEQYDKAITEFRNAINIGPNFKEAHCHLGVIYIEQHRYTEAINPLKKAISIDRDYKEAYFNLALAYLKLGEFEEAKDTANYALGIDPNYEPALNLIKFIAD